MSTTVNSPPVPPASLSANNVLGSLGSTLAGLAAAAPVIATSVSTMTFPTTLAGWFQVGLGILAVFSRA